MLEFTTSNIVSLAFFLAGLIFFYYSYKKITTGIGHKEFISSRYMYVKIPAGFFTKKLLIRKLTIASIIEIGDVPNWIQAIFIEQDINKLVQQTKNDLEKKSEKEIIEQSKQYYDFLQKIAEKSIVKWDYYVEEWKKVDPDFSSRLDDNVLQKIFELQISSIRGIVKKNKCYKDLQSLEKNSAKLRASTSSKKTVR